MREGQPRLWFDTCIDSRKPRPGEAMGEALLAVLPGKGWNREPGDPLIRFPVFFSLRIWTRSLSIRRSRHIAIRRGTCVPLRPFRSRLQAGFFGRHNGSRALEMGAFLSPQPRMVAWTVECPGSLLELHRESSRFFLRWLECVRLEPGYRPGSGDRLLIA
jgi:hypothetical protein